MREGTIFSLFVSLHLGWEGGHPDQVWMVGGVPQPGLDGWWGYSGQVWMVGGTGRGYPSQVWMVGVPRPGLDNGGYPSQVWMVGGTLWARSGWWGYLEYPPPWLDVVPPFHHDWMGYPPQWLDGIPHPHHDWMGYPPPPTMTGWGTPPPPPPPPPWFDPTSIASTCYTAGGMPLAFTQEDFLFVSFQMM